MLQRMRNEFCWFKNMRYTMTVLCPVCCRGGRAANYCNSHDIEGCKEEQCLHFWSLSELCNARETVICTERESAFAQNVTVQVRLFLPWLPLSTHQGSFFRKLRSFPSRPASTSQESLESSSSVASSRTLRVTLLSSEWRSTKGGMSTINRELAIQLAKHHNVEVSMYLPQCSEEDIKDADRHHVKLIQARKLVGFEPMEWLSSAPENHQMDFVIGHGLILGRQVQLIQRQHHCKWIQVVHTAPEDLGMFKDYSGAISRGEGKQRAEIGLCESADQVVAIGPKLADEYSCYLRYSQRDQTVFVLTPSIFSEFSQVKQTPKEGTTFRVLAFGRGDNEDFKLKGYDIAAKAISQLNEESYQLIFVGAPPGKEEEIADKLCQHGIERRQLKVRSFKENRDDLARLFCEVDLAIMPSRTEGFGLAALEALSAGLPILVSGNSGFGDALKKVPHGSNWVVNSEDPKEWAKAVRSVRTKGRDVRLEESKDLRKRYAEKYSWQQQCEGLVKRMANSFSGEQPSSVRSRHMETDVISEGDEEARAPTEILARGPVALEAHNKAIANGQTSVKRVPVMLIGHEGAGKNSLKESLKGICSNSVEKSSIRNAVDPPEDIRESLLSQSCEPQQIVNLFKEKHQLKEASLKQPDSETKKWIRRLSTEANLSDRLDVVKHLRTISPAGTTGPLLPENLDVREIPSENGRQLTIALSGGDEWKQVAEKLGLNSNEIRFLDCRVMNPADALLAFVANQRCLTVGELYDVLRDCGLPVMADEL